MKKHSISLFGLPTLFTVLIVVLIISFATLSYLDTLNIKHSIERGNQILKDSYTLQKDMEIEIQNIERGLNQGVMEVHNKVDWTYDRAMQVINLSLDRDNLRLDVKMEVIEKDKIELEVIEWQLTSGNKQDYTQDGDPVYGG